MLWFELFLGYCVLVAIGMWVGYRSRKSWPSPDSDASDFEVTGAEDPVETGTRSSSGLR
jgi:hypothetical protein